MAKGEKSDGSKRRGSADSSGLEQSFAAALRAAKTAPDSEDAWDHLEELADKLQRPDEVAELYTSLLGGKLPAEQRTRLSKRAVKFHDEWFGDNPEAMNELLSKIIATDPEAEWAFERLTVVLTVAERWSDLLGLYDRTLETTREPDRRKKLLDDAAHVAKDFADAPERAVDYMQALLALDPSNVKLASSIERLLERQRRWKDLIELWQAQIPRLPVDEGRSTRVRIAAVYLEHLESAGPALEEIRALLDESAGHAEGCAQLERILDFEGAPADVRLAALTLLRTNYDAVDRGRDFVGVLERAVTFADAAERTALYREAGVRLAILGRDEQAMGHYAALLANSPADTDARKQLRQLARRSGLHGLQADALVAAAEAAPEDGQRISLLLEAADLVQEALSDADRAIGLYDRVLSLAEADPSLALSAAHRLDELLAHSGRSAERLAVLERLATLERASSVRRSVLGDAGRLADELGDPDRALQAWQARLESDASDLEALDATVTLLEKHERWAPLVEALRRRAAAVPLAQQSRADLVRVAEVHEQRLEAIGDAIDTWLHIRERFGDAQDVVAALDRLMSHAGRFPELAEIIEQSAQRGRLGSARLLARLGDVHRDQLHQPQQAVRFYGEALGVDPSDAQARAGLQALLSDDACAGQAAELLARAYRITDDWQLLLDLIEVRVAGGQNPRSAVEVLREAAALYENRSADSSAAQAAIARALVLDPSDTGLEHELMRLAEQTQDWAGVADAHRRAVEESGPSPARAAHLYRREGELRERLDDHEGATRAYGAASEFDPESLVIQRAVIRVAAASDGWGPAARGVVRLSKVRGVLDEETLADLAGRAAVQDAWAKVAGGLVEAIADIELPADMARAFEATVARWYRDHVGDLDAAEAAAQRAVRHDPRHQDTLALLAELQRRHPSPELVSTLLQLDELTDRNLDPLREAAQVALQAESQGTLDPDATRDIVAQLYRKAARLFSRGEQVAGTHQPEATAAWARDELIDAMLEDDDKDGAIGLLLGATQLPFAADVNQDLRVRAARLSAEQGDNARAIELLLRVLEERRDDLTLTLEAATLCEEEGRVLELTTLRRRELELTDDAGRRLELRLLLSDLAGKLERQGGRVESLRENLADVPGHAASIEALVDVLTDKGRFAALADVLTEQAQMLQDGGNIEGSAGLWARVAKLVEEHFSDVPRAIEALRRVVGLHPSNQALDDLARLHLAQEEPGEAARWLEQRLQTTDSAQQVAVRLRLARAQIAAERPTDAISTLEVAFEEAPRNGEVRKLLLRLYRKHEQWEPLARALTVATEHVGDTATILAYAREAAEIYHDRLDQPGQAVPVLERAHTLAPDDRKLRSMLAEGLRVAGRLPEAHELLTELIEDFGRRRSAERAGVHLQLARVAHAQGDAKEALDQLELASKMDSGNPTIMRTLAQMSREAGELDRAERAYRALLLQVRRGGDEEANPVIGAATVLIELSSIASERGQSEQAEELVESALEALAADDGQAAELQKTLSERGENALLLRVLQTRLQHVHSGRRRADVLADLATLYAGPLEEPGKALDARLEALEQDPGSPVHHQRARELAEQTEQLDRYIDHVADLLERARRNTDVHVRCELLLRLGEAMERRSDFDRAAELYAQAEATGVREVDVWRASARLAGARGDTEEQVRLLARLAELGEDQSETRADALYRMAEVHLAHEDGLEEGVATLRRALSENARPERAARILRRASETHPPNLELLELYDSVARKSDDSGMLLHAIERRAAHSETTPEYVREGVTLALEQQEGERAEALMLRAVELGEALLDGPARVSWALLGLARRRLEGGDLAGAVKWVGEASESAPLPELLELGHEVAAVAMAEDGDPSLAAKLYESLLERDPSARAAWEPLAGIYRTLDDVERLHRLVDETLDGLQDTAERNALRLMLVECMLPKSEHQDDALQTLRDVLLEDPDHIEAQRLMAEHLQRTGNREELLDLLRQQLMNAQGRGEPTSVAACALRLGEQLEQDDPTEAAVVYRGAMEFAPRDPALLRALLAHLGGEDAMAERGDVLDQLIEVEDADTAAERALQLADLRNALEDGAAALQALRKGYQRKPDHAVLRERLEQAYASQGDYAGLVKMLLSAASGEEDPAIKLAVMRQVAALQREQLGNPGAAIRTLEQARALAPEDTELAAELVATLVAAGRLDDAGSLVSEQLEQAGDDPSRRLPLLVKRAELRAAIGDLDGMIEDLEVARTIDDSYTASLVEAIDRKRQAAAEAGNTDTERATTLRWVELQLQAGHADEARELLAAWTERERKDVDALQLLRKIDTAAERWEVVAKTCARLVAVENGEEQAEAGLALAHACKQLGRPELARPGLEHARRKQPEHRGIRQALAEVYEATAMGSELAKLLAQEAEETEDPAARLEILRRAANLHLEVGELDQAMPLIRQIIELAPDDLVSAVLLIDAHMSMGELDEAEVALERAIEGTGGRRSPELSALLHRKARIAGARGDHQAQIDLLQQAFSTDKGNGQAAAELADLAEALEDWDLAVKTLRTITVLEDCPISKTEAFLRQAKIAFRRGDRQRAVLWARKARHEAPEDQDVLAFLAELGEG
ncbi:tetratricopeptide repeat protein [Paraliomyxa miuraensis]|uniref:tetratricopeptide repeat protein n=1 Tax=Paraliomyxa miuraensis TaxID=376150 RepID=UPI00225983C3|nr:tetratricopeptide repeat protein [Paraliomyxa miuraensis]MCX4241103.1 tetratricopeptide repeat protein [Paraliomyxa miuraensis]